MALHPKLKLFIWGDNLLGKPIHTYPPAIARRGLRRYFEKIAWYADGAPVPLPKVKDISFEGWKGANLPLRAYYPTTQTASQPVMLFFHGGGFVVGDLDMYDRLCRHTARDTGAVVLSVDYRLAPEFPFPTAAEDCYAAVCWTVEHAGELGIDPQRVAVMGDSAGGNLAAAVCLMARDRQGPKICQQVLIYPVTDLTLSTPSSTRKGKGYWLTRDTMKWYVENYTPEEHAAKSLYASMMLASPEQLHNLPPALVLTAEYDPLVDEGARYAKQLQAAGNQVEYRDYAGMIHGFYMMGRMLRSCRLARTLVAETLRKAFGLEEGS